ncbi:MAG TPA: phage baseplate assembly protein V, partial [Kofleriaceae bacterium]|nr:phage baseplate assembly protein V [Kofleriaceae bacterium]
MTYAFRPQDLDRRLYGVFAGIVEDNNDPEHEGRVTLRLPWLDDATVTDWCRVAQPYAGNGFGAVW